MGLYPQIIDEPENSGVRSQEPEELGCRSGKFDEFVKSPKTVMPDLIRYPELVEINGFLPDSIRDLPEWQKRSIPDFLRDRQI